MMQGKRWIKLHIEGIWKKYYLEVKDAINHFYDIDDVYLTVKKIRKYLKVDASNRSKINFIWRLMNHFEFEGVIVQMNQISKKRAKQYKIVKSSIKNNVMFVDEQLGV